MTRPCWYVGMAWLAACLVGAWMSLNVLLIVTVGSLLCFCVMMAVPALRRHRRLLLISGGGSVALLVLLLFETCWYLPLKGQVNSTVSLSMQVYEADDGIYARVTDGDLPTGTRLQLWIADQDQQPRESEVLSGRFVLCEREKDGLALLSQKASGVWFAAVPSEAIVSDGPPLWTTVFSHWKEAATDRIRTHLSGDEAALTAGICFGADEELSADSYGNFRVSGISHLLSVSGFHMVMLSQALLWLLKKCRLPRPVPAITATGILLLFMLLVGLEPSVIRSGVLCLLVLLGSCFRRQADTRNSLGLALLVLLAADPYAAYDVSLLLSFSATFGLVLLLPWLKQGALKLVPAFVRKHERICAVTENLIHAIGVTVAASLATLPVMTLCFGEISVVAVLTNLLASLPATVLMMAGCVGTLCFFWPLKALEGLLFLICGWMSRYLLWITEKISNFPLVTVAIRPGYLLLWIVGTMALVWLGWKLARARGLGIAAVVGAFALIVGSAAHAVLMTDVTRVRVLPTDGDLAVVLQKDDQAVLICAPEEIDTVYTIRNQLRIDGIGTLDTVIIPSGDENTLLAMPLLLGDRLDDARLIYGGAAEVLIPQFEEATPLTDAIHTIGKGTAVTAYESFLWVTAGETRILISTGDGSVTTLPAERRVADAVIYGGTLPTDRSLLHGSVGVIQGSRRYRYGAWELGVERLLTASAMEDVLLMTRGAGDIDG